MGCLSRMKKFFLSSTPLVMVTGTRGGGSGPKYGYNTFTPMGSLSPSGGRVNGMGILKTLEFDAFGSGATILELDLSGIASGARLSAIPQGYFQLLRMVGPNTPSGMVLRSADASSFGYNTGFTLGCHAWTWNIGAFDDVGDSYALTFA